MHTRREFCTVIAAGAACASPLSRALAKMFQSERFEVISLREGFSAILGEGGNSLLVETTDGVVLIDAKHPFSGPALLRLCEEKLGQPPRLLLNTHHHGDHTGGNHAFKETSRIIAHENCAPRVREQFEMYRSRSQQAMNAEQSSAEMRQDAQTALANIEKHGEAAFAPDELVSARTNRMELTLGDRRVVLKRFGDGHTDNDLVVHFPEANVLHTGDLVFHGIHPYMDPPAGTDSKGWIEALRRAIELCDEETIVIPGHGGIGGVQALHEQIAYFRALRESVERAIEEGKTREQVEALRVEAVQGLARGQMLSRNLGIIHDELSS